MPSAPADSTGCRRHYNLRRKAWPPRRSPSLPMNRRRQQAAQRRADRHVVLAQFGFCRVSTARTRRPDWQLCQGLRRALGNVANLYFDNPAFRQTPPKLLIWEIPERDLQTIYGRIDKLDVPVK
ncbi:hypothetical protein ALQ93_04821 [Pseudomonas syringae pv. pisi]|uniref:Uncharacterized protein n=3 Tax=Pseudomonas syringae group TaxID=136849 RepID=A0A3M2WFY5_PSESJ|nr:hypothetical protein ALQ96_101256 [Pseudomonas syringae pv. atrofaciens]RML50426.1 hypothetical protein ALQ93_04821 [Pseudomonas syringae pv. pisi]RMU66721.1 hypothetical protein ALP24_101751 [Pseudomonas syringae pv. aptata]RMU90226.1 hypothetical protein ALP21_04689 [Pseudomonas savastanoi pv. phaseolicola]RML64392.1 hypothetical protein ALQ92_05220 [Pseudomonas syringae pv. pisi]